MKIIVMGASGMLGHAVLAVLSKNSNLDVIGTVRTMQSINGLNINLRKRCHVLSDIENLDQLVSLFSTQKPDIVVNCIGVIKQLEHANDPISVLPINSIFPHRLSNLCKLSNTRLIHISTDCVFSGNKGNYHEDDLSDATDLYGKSKYIGEVSYPHCVTLRTSIIGHELNGKNALLEWFLSQKNPVNGFSNAVFSGLPTNELARVISVYVIPNKSLSGVYHIASHPINKYDLLKKIAQVYKKEVLINMESNFKIDRSLNSDRFKKLTGYVPAEWPQLLLNMHGFNMSEIYV
jgi:dTDP-4-dehydrorhamnose reductase